MSAMAYIVFVETDGEPELWGFEDEATAQTFADVRGSAVTDVQAVALLDEHDAKRLIDAEAKERAEEERYDRMRDRGEA